MILSSFYTILMNRLMDANIGIKHFDLWNEQIRNMEEDEENDPVLYPAVYLEYDPQEWETLGKKKQQAQITFKLHVCSEVYGETAHREGAIIINANLAHLVLLDNIFYHLQGYNTTNIGSISRIGLSFSTSYRNLKEDVLDFHCLLTDIAAQVEYVHPDPAPTQTITI